MIGGAGPIGSSTGGSSVGPIGSSAGDSPAGLDGPVGRLLLHAGEHVAESSNAVGAEYVAASVAFVGIVGGLLYWYFGRWFEAR